MKRTLILSILLSVVMVTVSSGRARAGIIADFTLNEQDSIGTTTNDVSFGPFTDTSFLAPDISSPIAVPVGHFGSNGGGGTTTNEINWTSWNTGFLTVELTVAGGYSLDLSDIQLRISRNGAAAPGALADPLYAVVLPGTGYTFDDLAGATQLSTVDDIVISGGAGGSFSAPYSLWDLSDADIQIGSFTIGIGYNGTKGGNLRISDIIVDGIITPTPEPSTTALALLGAAGFVGLVTRRRA